MYKCKHFKIRDIKWICIYQNYSNKNVDFIKEWSGSLLTQLIEAQLNELNTNISKKYPYSFVIKGKPSP
jgi:hypothetical protein